MPYAGGSWSEKAKARSKTRNEYFNEYRKTRRDPKKIMARKLVELAVKSGEMTKLGCERANELCNARVEGHHDDYDLPLSVMWLCSYHHRERHKEIAPPSESSGSCFFCGKGIFFPKVKYCSNYCNNAGWKREQGR